MRMKLAQCLQTAIGLIAAVAITAHAQDDGARDLVKRVLDAAPTAPLTAKAKLTSDRGWVRELDLSRKHMNDMDAVYMEVTAPMDLKDTRFLLFDRIVGKDEQFIFVPAIKRAIQVSSETRKQPFLGSDFYVYDMVRPEFDAYKYSFVGEEDVGGHHCKLVQSIPKNPEADLYGKTIVAIDPTDLIVLRTQFFDPEGKPLKVWTVEKIEKIDGQWTPIIQKMVNLQEGHQSQIELQEIKYNAKLLDEQFNRSYLTR